MKINRIVVGYLQENCYILEKNNCVIIVDPGDEFEHIDSFIHGQVIGILLTHHHFDHIGALDELKNKYHVEVNNFNSAPFSFETIFTPGHSWDSKTFYFKDDNIMFTGDFIFKGTIGRTDIGGSDKDMLKSLNKIITYPDNITIYPGHGAITKLGIEKPYLKSILHYN
jgi:hydroxyacylglutathione hydrolase